MSRRTHGDHWWGAAEAAAADPDTTAAALLRGLGGPDVPSRLLQLQVFVAREEDRAPVDAAVKAYCGPERPAVHTVVQRPCSGAGAAVLGWGLRAGHRGEVRRPGPGTVLLVDGDTEIGFHDAIQVGDDPGDHPGDERGWWRACFAALEERLRRSDRRVEDVVKTWTVYGRGPAGPRGHFEAFNEVRAEFLAGRTFPLTPEPRAVALPANTGVSARQRGVALAFLTYRSSGARARAMSNPEQLAPSDYPPAEIAVAPRFSRAVALPARDGDDELVLVAGTASVVGWRTAHPGEPLPQMHRTEALLARLLDPDGEHGDRDPFLGRVVYLAPGAADDALVRAASARPPSVLVEADLSRPDLCVEVDAVASRPASRCAGPPQ